MGRHACPEEAAATQRPPGGTAVPSDVHVSHIRGRAGQVGLLYHLLFLLGHLGVQVLLCVAQAGLQQGFDLLLAGPEAVLGGRGAGRGVSRRQEAGSSPRPCCTPGRLAEDWSRCCIAPLGAEAEWGQGAPQLPCQLLPALTGEGGGWRWPGAATHRVTLDHSRQEAGQAVTGQEAVGGPQVQTLHGSHHAASRHHGRWAGDELDICNGRGSV